MNNNPMNTKACAYCGGLFTRASHKGSREFEGRQFCSPRCSQEGQAKRYSIFGVRLTAADIASMLNIPIGTIRSRAKRHVNLLTGRRLPGIRYPNGTSR